MTELREKLNNIVEEKNTKIIPENLRQGAEAFGVQGTFTSDATATAEDILKDKTAYVNGGKITGTLEVSSDNEYNCKSKLVQANNATQLVIGNNVTTELDLSGIDMTGITSIANLFIYFGALTKVVMPNTSNIDTFDTAFSGCRALVEAPECETSKSIEWSKTFNACSALETVPLYDFSNATVVAEMFAGCTNLKNLGGFLNYGKAIKSTATNARHKLDLSASTLITHDSLMNVINNLYDLNLTYNVANGGTLYRQYLILGSTNLAKLTEEEKAIATNKGWLLA